MTLVVLRLIIMQLIDEFVLTKIFSDKTSNGLFTENLLRSRFESFQLTMKN